MRAACWLTVCFWIAIFRPSEQTYGEWQQWSGCTSTCFSTLRNRKRFCIQNTTCSPGFITEADICNKDYCSNLEAVIIEIPFNASCGGYKTNFRNCPILGKLLPEPCRNKVVTKCDPCTTASISTKASYVEPSTSNKNPQTSISTKVNSVKPTPQVFGDPSIAIGVGVGGGLLVVMLVVVSCLLYRRWTLRQNTPTKPVSSIQVSEPHHYESVNFIKNEASGYEIPTSRPHQSFSTQYIREKKARRSPYVNMIVTVQ